MISPSAANPPIIDSILLIEQTKSPSDLFGKDKSQFDVILRRLKAGCHPDRFDKDPVLKLRSGAAFNRLMEFHSQLTGIKPKPSPVTINGFTVGGGFVRGDLCDLFHGSGPVATDVGVLKLVRSAKDNDLMDAESSALTLLHKSPDSTLQRFFPRLLTTGKSSGRRANAVGFSEDLIPLADFNTHWPLLDFRHVVWMANRALTALIFAHSRGLIHGAVVPSHLLFDIAEHDLRLVDWCYSVGVGSNHHIPALVSRFKWLYPAEVTRKLPPTPATDIFMLFRSLSTLNTQWPARFTGIRRWATAESPNARPQSADGLLDQWIDLAKQEFGKPKFIPLELKK